MKFTLVVLSSLVTSYVVFAAPSTTTPTTAYTSITSAIPPKDRIKNAKERIQDAEVRIQNAKAELQQRLSGIRQAAQARIQNAEVAIKNAKDRIQVEKAELQEKLSEIRQALEAKLQPFDDKIQNFEATIENAEEKIQSGKMALQQKLAAAYAEIQHDLDVIQERLSEELQNLEGRIESAEGKIQSGKVGLQVKLSEAELKAKMADAELNMQFYEKELELALKVIMNKAELELQEMELKVNAIRAFRDKLEPFTTEQLLLFSRFLENQKMQNHTLDQLKPLVLYEFLMKETSMTAEQLLLLQKIKNDDSIDEEDALLLHEMKEQSGQSSSSRSDSSSEDRGETVMSLEQKVLEARILQGIGMTHEQMLRLAVLRSHQSGRTTLQELFLLHNVNANITPEQLLLLKSFTPNQILKLFFLQNSGDITLGNGKISSIIHQLPELARTKVLLENNELAIYSLIQNIQNNDELPSLAELALLHRYQDSMSHSLRRSKFLLKLTLINMIQSEGEITEEQKELAVVLLHRLEEQQSNELMIAQEAMMIRRYRQGKDSLAATVAYFHRMEVMMSSGVGAHLRSLAMNKIRISMIKGSGIGMNDNGMWMPGWLNNTEWMNATESERIQELWLLYKLRHNRDFKQRHEESKRRRNFEKKVSEVIMHNIEYELGMHLFCMGMNNMSDWSESELSTLRGFVPSGPTQADLAAQAQDVLEGQKALGLVPVMPTYTATLAASSLPAYVNWTNTSWVGPIQNQGQCGSCWSFSTAGALEAQYYNKTQTFVAMSEQNLIDCTYYLGNLGCEGGNVELAFEYVRTVGIDTYASYPYGGWDNNGTCLYSAADSVTQDSGWMLIGEGDEVAMQQAIAQVGPVSAAIDASLSSFDSYSGGVYAPANCSTTALDHAILVVGYGTTDDGQAYWLIKNSWGTDWGINGYMMMERGVNMCGIATEALFPLIN